MRGTLDPVTLAKIDAFARRRRTLILARGLCAVLAILLSAMTALALFDYFVLLPDEARWALSVAAYGAALFTAWFTCARLLWNAPDARVLARFIEQLRPELREDLLSAVELGDPRGRERWDSEEFREILQQQVAERVRAVQVESLLSFRRISRWGYAAGGILGLCVVLLLIPGLRYDNLLLRSLLPGANLERISRVRVTVLEPSPPERVVPQGDPVPLRVEVSDPDVAVAVLETFAPGKKPERSEMKPAGKGLFESALQVGREPVVYRVRSADAMTRKYTLTPVSRPEAVTFHKVYHYPEYTGMKPRPETTKEKGDLITLEGTVVDLRIEVNQEVEKGSLQIEQAGKSREVVLEPAGMKMLSARVPVTAPGTYKIYLKGRETLFENKFSPQYEIRPMPDLIPRVTLEDPVLDQILPPDEVVLVKGTAKDDLGLRKVIQMVRLNQGDWKETLLSENPGPTFAIAHRWDLFELRVQPGDRLTMKLLAIDLKGSRAESQPVHITISAPGFDPQRLVPLAAKEQVYQALLELRDGARDVQKKISDAAARPAGDELARRQAVLNAAADAEKLSQQAETVEARAKDALRLSRGGREASDLVLVARLARRLKEDPVAAARAEIEGAAGPEALKRAAGSLREAAGEAAVAEESVREILAAEEAMAILNDLRDLSRDEAAIHRQAVSALAAKDAKVWERLSRRQGVAVSQAKSLDEVLQVLAAHAAEGHNKRAAAVRNQVKAAREALEKALTKGADPNLYGPSQVMQREVDAALAVMHGLEQDLGRLAQRQREALAKRSEPSFADVSAVAREAGKGAPRAVERWKGARAQLEARASVEESRKDQDPFFVADSALAGRALQAVLEVHLANPDAAKSKETLQIVERAYRTLETGHGLAELSSALRELAEGERWAGPSPNLLSRHPKDWQWLEARARNLPEEFKAAGLPVEALGELQKSWRGLSGEAARREMNERLQFGRRPGGVAAPLERLGGEAGKGLSAIQPAMEAARRELRKLVPSLAERLGQLAQAAEKIQKKTETLAEKAPRSEAAQTRPEARSLLETQQNIDRQIDEAMTDLRRDANLQNLFTEQGREKARDADDAVAMLQQSPPKAEELLAQAASSPQPQAQEQTLAKAAEQQGKLADALKTLAEHYKNAEAGKPEETRPELRKAEEALGIKDALDKQYAQMAKLAELAKQPANDALKAALQSEAAQNEALQRQLEQLAQNALDRAEQALQQAAQMEQQAAQQAARKAQEQNQQGRTLAEQARKIADEARRMARQDVPQLQKEAEKAQAPAAQAPLAQAAQDLEKGAAAVPQSLDDPPQAAKGLENAAKELARAAQDLQQAQAAEQQAVKVAQERAQSEQQQAQAAQQAAQKQAQMAEQAKQAAQQAKTAAKQAQDAAKQQPQDAEAQKAAQQAQKAAQAAEKAADQAGQQSKQAQAAAQKESAEAAQAQAAEQSAQAAAQNAGKEAQQAQSLAQQAQALANAARQQGQSQQGPMAQAAQQQAKVGEMVQQAAGDIQQAAKNEQALGAAEQAQTLEQVAQATQAVAQNEVQAAQQAAQGQSAQQAAQTAERAQQAIQAQANALAQARAAAQTQQGPPQEGPPAPSSGLSEQASQLLAQALNALNGEKGQGQPPGQQGQAQQAVQSAAQAQSQSMAEGRSQGRQGQGPPGQSQGNQPGQAPFSQTPGSGKGASVEAGRMAEGQLPPGALLKPGEWGKLPPRLARDLMEAQRESVGGEYRNMVETYFRVIAERAKEKK